MQGITTVWDEREDPEAGALAGQALAGQRRRFAADLHDLVMQDLALALANARKLAEHPACAAQAGDVVAAGERALAGARRMLEDLSGGERTPVVEAVEASVRAAARTTPLRFHADRVPCGAQPDTPTLVALVHVGREAVTNATKHASASTIEVVLEREDEWRLRIRDDGRGCDPDAVERGFGLQSMRRCVHALGGLLCVTSEPELGTTVEAVLP